ncbi:MAG TPA: CDP-diacylglycerol--glycerol-3-phosphate 3-phosphatidyltransferase [Deltaproteobacteria bacterium]|jgi:CDP-diacylglycerol--glycerol-3-phosphate 3-phosphatidyltransferase|nr:CDP-diacylglycerol--glycerol-3-phosphate 3-phosphatidyltransferase [Deltaproteobacteria bacterium]HOI06296.1 CDP-diacylglycerol--glycerol-3-phosphate 3-phosphatidyltransferase [Deltaproteobacteria bacterium]
MNLANILTLSRIIVVPVIACLLLRDNWITSLIAAFLFLCAAITDYLDGYLARKLHMESDLGKLLDPLADKLLIATVLILLIPLGRVPAWMVVIIIGRELAVTGIRALASEKQVVIGATWLGKYKTAFQCVALIPLLVHYQYQIYPLKPLLGQETGNPLLTLQFQQGGEFFLWIAFFFTVWSGWDYIYSYGRSIVGQEASQ